MALRYRIVIDIGYPESAGARLIQVFYRGPPYDFMAYRPSLWDGQEESGG